MPKYKEGDYVRYNGDLSIVRIVTIEDNKPKYQIYKMPNCWINFFAVI